MARSTARAPRRTARLPCPPDGNTPSKAAEAKTGLRNFSTTAAVGRSASRQLLSRCRRHAFASYSTTFTTNATSQIIAFAGTNQNGGDNTVFIDDATLTPQLSESAHAASVGTNPGDSSNRLAIREILPNAANVDIRFTTVAGRIYHLEGSDTLGADSWTVLQNGIVGTGADVRFTETSGARHPRRFYRIVITR